ncbi:phage tail fiber protein [Rhizobacter sp. Root1221]|uniref:phage tail fiber domain-containing protein n=1 Tax=Rhizobacter sp. Root1221 TaxID=1736433 RepID=UPI0006FDD460|nr:phage tail fiber protein [Rhizobacter sp. Root1221]KQV99964.1 hypothetical protein ASC87_19885 [Rhizobacter sp. Root1221]
MLTTYITDGVQTRFTFNWPYLDRANIIVTRGEVAAPFSFIDDHTVQVRTIFGEPLPEGETLKILRTTPDLVTLVQYKDATMLTAADLNRARLQCLFLIQERSGGLTGSVAQAIQNLTNEIETISGALDSIQYTAQLLTAGLQTLDELTSDLDVVKDGAAILQQLIADTVAKYDASIDALVVRVDSVESRQNSFQSAVSQQVATLASNDLAFASRVDTVEARINAIDQDGDQEDPLIAASIITAAVAQAKSHVAQAHQIETLRAEFGDVDAMIQTEQLARASADEALAQQITALQTSIGGNLAQVIAEMQADVDAVDGKVTNLNAQYTLKVAVQRQDGKPVMAGIGIAATSNGDISASEIVMQADRLVFSQPGDPNAPLKPIFIAGNVDGSPTMVIPSNVMGDRTYPGRLLVDGTIEGRSIKADEIAAGHLKAGAITARELAVSLGSNLLRNSEFTERVGTIPTSWTYGVSSDLASYCTTFYDYPNYSLLGGHSLAIQQSGGPTTGAINTTLAYWYSDMIPVVAGTRYEFSLYAGAHRCLADVYLQWYTAAGAGAGVSGTVDSGAAYAVPSDSSWPAGPSLVQHKRIGGIGLAPAGATQVRMFIRKGATNAGAGDSWLFLTHPMIAEANPNATALSPYNPSGLMTLVTPGGISTPSLAALSATIGTLRTATTGARTEITDNVIKVYDANNVVRVKIGNLLL